LASAELIAAGLRQPEAPQTSTIGNQTITNDDLDCLVTASSIQMSDNSDGMLVAGNLRSGSGVSSFHVSSSNASSVVVLSQSDGLYKVRLFLWWKSWQSWQALVTYS
jgi:hypothetical protein